MLVCMMTYTAESTDTSAAWNLPILHTQSSKEEGFSKEYWRELEKYSWFWGGMSRRACEERMRREGGVGNFVVRVNSDNNFVMSCWYISFSSESLIG